jgi:hypothetical protein
MVNRAHALKLRQTAKGVVVFYKGKESLKPKIRHNNRILNELTVNGSITTHQVNLNDGQILQVNYSDQSPGDPVKIKISVEQHKDARITI